MHWPWWDARYMVDPTGCGLCPHRTPQNPHNNMDILCSFAFITSFLLFSWSHSPRRERCKMNSFVFHHDVTASFLLLPLDWGRTARCSATTYRFFFTFQRRFNDVGRSGVGGLPAPGRHFWVRGPKSKQSVSDDESGIHSGTRGCASSIPHSYLQQRGFSHQSIQTQGKTYRSVQNKGVEQIFSQSSVWFGKRDMLNVLHVCDSWMKNQSDKTVVLFRRFQSSWRPQPLDNKEFVSSWFKAEGQTRGEIRRSRLGSFHRALARGQSVEATLGWVCEKNNNQTGLVCSFCHMCSWCSFILLPQNVLIDEEKIGDSREPWEEITLYWSPPSTYQGHIEFRYR